MTTLYMIKLNTYKSQTKLRAYVQELDFYNAVLQMQAFPNYYKIRRNCNYTQNSLAK